MKRELSDRERKSKRNVNGEKIEEICSISFVDKTADLS